MAKYNSVHFRFDWISTAAASSRSLVKNTSQTNQATNAIHTVRLKIAKHAGVRFVVLIVYGLMPQDFVDSKAKPVTFMSLPSSSAPGPSAKLRDRLPAARKTASHPGAYISKVCEAIQKLILTFVGRQEPQHPWTATATKNLPFHNIHTVSSGIGWSSLPT